MKEPTPKLFDRAPRTLFGPLGDLYAELYWDLLASLYACEFEREPFVVARVTAIEAAESVIRDSPVWISRRQELEESIKGEEGLTDGLQDEADVVRALARRLITRVEKSGWVHFQYRSGMGEILSFHPYAARILETLLRIARDEQPIFQGYVHSIAALLDARTFMQRPGVSLSEAKRHTADLVRELKILERNIHLFTQRILDEAATAASVLQEDLDRYEQAVMANYHRLKTIDNVFRQRSVILDRLDAIERDDLAMDAAAGWYAMQRGSGKQQGRAAVQDDLLLLRAQFDVSSPHHRRHRRPEFSILGRCAAEDSIPPTSGPPHRGTAAIHRRRDGERRLPGLRIRRVTSASFSQAVSSIHLTPKGLAPGLRRL